MKNNHITLNIDDELLKKIESVARIEGRTITNVIYLVVKYNIDYALKNAKTPLETYTTKRGY